MGKLVGIRVIIKENLEFTFYLNINGITLSKINKILTYMNNNTSPAARRLLKDLQKIQK